MCARVRAVDVRASAVRARTVRAPVAQHGAPVATTAAAALLELLLLLLARMLEVLSLELLLDRLPLSW
jgi:hypothetical protein